mmetsp:Transcript_28549/g.94745  ORF Transcript_28549/g.94745 Transcript_28549/m.94745 type:complete len:153 (+) Transcript_28549:315-773(+)
MGIGICVVSQDGKGNGYLERDPTTYSAAVSVCNRIVQNLESRLNAGRPQHVQSNIQHLRTRAVWEQGCPLRPKMGGGDLARDHTTYSAAVSGYENMEARFQARLLFRWVFGYCIEGYLGTTTTTFDVEKAGPWDQTCLLSSVSPCGVWGTAT